MLTTGEIVEWPLYDTVELESFGKAVQLFALPVGSTVASVWENHSRGKDFWETNLYTSGMLDPPCVFFVRDIQALLFDEDGLLPVCDRSGMAGLWAKSYLQFSINQKLYWQGPLSLVADPVCQMGSLETLRGLPEDGLKILFEMLNYQVKHPLDVMIRQQEPFSVRVVPYAPIRRRVYVRVVLNGKMTRAVL